MCAVCTSEHVSHIAGPILDEKEERKKKRNKDCTTHGLNPAQELVRAYSDFIPDRLFIGGLLAGAELEVFIPKRVHLKLHFPA